MWTEAWHIFFVGLLDVFIKINVFICTHFNIYYLFFSLVILLQKVKMYTVPIHIFETGFLNAGTASKSQM